MWARVIPLLLKDNSNRIYIHKIYSIVILFKCLCWMCEKDMRFKTPLSFPYNLFFRVKTRFYLPLISCWNLSCNDFKLWIHIFSKSDGMMTFTEHYHYQYLLTLDSRLPPLGKQTLNLHSFSHIQNKHLNSAPLLHILWMWIFNSISF